MPTPHAAPAVASARDELHTARTRLTCGLAHARAGRVTSALGELERADPHDPDLDDLERTTLLTVRIDCRLARGELTAGAELGTRLDRYLDRPGDVGATAHLGRGELAAASGAPDLAASHFSLTGRLVTAEHDDPAGLPWRSGLALAAVRIGRRTEAVLLAREQLALARERESPYGIALGLRTMATVGTHGDRTVLLDEARDALVGVRADRLAAQIDTDLAGLLLLSDRPDAAEQAVALLRAAEEYAGREELAPLLGRTRRLLGRLGEAPLLSPAEVLSGLTVSERRVTLLAAEGLTNREIATQLAVTTKAVEWHLSNSYRKLGIRSRSGLASLTETAGRGSDCAEHTS